MCCLLCTATVIDYFLFNHVTALLMKTDHDILNKYMALCAQQASTEETIHNTTHVQPHKITKTEIATMASKI